MGDTVLILPHSFLDLGLVPFCHAPRLSELELGDKAGTLEAL